MTRSAPRQPSRPRPPQGRAGLQVLLAFALAGCINPVLPPGTGGRAPSALSQPSARGVGAISLIDPALALPAHLTPAGKELTLVVSAAASAASPLRFAVTPDAPASGGQALRLQQAGAGNLGWPYTAAFTRNRLLPALPRVAGPPRRLLAADRPLGSEERFWINTGSSFNSDDRERTCVLKRASAHALLYVDPESKAISDANLDRLVAEWEERIYPRLTAVFGQEARPGIDGEARIFIVLSPAVDNWGKEKGLMGYFWSRDAIPGGGGNSNQKEVLFMTDQLFDRPELTSFGTLAHEFQHLLNFSRKSARLGYRLAEETWLDEGLSMYAMEVAGYGLPAGDYHIAKDLREFEERPEAFSLTEWSSNPNGFAYGQSYLFVRYLVDRFGPAVVPALLESNRAGVACVSEVLKARGTTFPEVFRAWAVTNLVSDAPLAQGTPYSYKGLPLTGLYKSSTGGEDILLRGFQTRPATRRDFELLLKPWGTAYLTFSAESARPWHLALEAGTESRLLGATVVP